ncbi:hypothetical protein ACTQ5J_08915 [Fundicoccus sp. Sow4_F4]|uniref:hypothetical protein n=1 Tax=Fundicoccus sp. Sow4_F4 TaxID=3438783 RepID=UPI003F9150A3
MKKYVSLFLALIMIFTLASCGGKTEENTTVSLPAVATERAAVEQAGAIATQQYIIARLKTEALIEYDIENGSIDELKAMTADTLEAWRLCELASVQAAELADYAQSLRSSASTQAATTSYTSSSPAGIGLFTMVAYAAEENAAVKWAKELTEKYDSYPSGQKIKQLSENLGTDAKNAFAQLKMAQNILEGEAYSAEGDTMQSFENAAMATKTACKTGLYIGGVIASGGTATGILEAGGMVISGVDTIVDIASTGSTIILGENNKVTMAANDLKDIVGPIASIAGGVNVFSGDSIKAGIKAGAEFSKQMGSLDKLNYIGESVLDLVSEGKILGGTITVGDDGETTVTMTEISTEGKTPDEMAKELKEVGLPVPEEAEPKTAAELAEEIEEEYYYTEEELNEVIENLRNLLYEMFLDSEESTAPPSEEMEKGKTGLSLDDIAGTYSMNTYYDGKEQQHTVVFTKNGDKLVASSDAKGEEPFELSYDPASGTASYVQKIPHEDSEITIDSKYTFILEDGSTKVNGETTMLFKDETKDGPRYEGYKTD